MNIKKLFEEIENVFVEKQSKYGQVDVKIKNMLKELYPNGVKPEQYNEFMNVLKMLEKISRLTNENIDIKGKSDALVDLAGYAMLGVKKMGEQSEPTTEPSRIVQDQLPLDFGGTASLGDENRLQKDVEAMAQWIKSGTVNADYLKDIMGDPMIGVSPQVPLKFS